MPKKKKNTGFGSPKTFNPMDEMSWCFKRHIYITTEPEVYKGDDGWKMTGNFAIKISQGQKQRLSEYKYNKDNVMDAIFDAYREIYKRNYGKEKQE